MIYVVTGKITIPVKIYIIDADSEDEAMLIAEEQCCPRSVDLRDLVGIPEDDGFKSVVELEGDVMYKFDSDIESVLESVERL